MPMGKAYAIATVIRLLAIALNAVGALLLLPFVLKALGQLEFGIWAMATSITGYLLLLDLGVALACTRYLAVHQGDAAAWRRTLSSAWVLAWGVAGILLVAAGLVQWGAGLGWLSTWHPRMADVVSLLLVEVALSIPLRLFQSVLRAEMRYTLIGVLEILRIMLRLLGIPLLLWLGGGLMAILVYASAVNVLFFALMLPTVYRRNGTLFLGRHAVVWGHLRELFRFSQYAALAQVAEFFKYRADNLLVGVLLGVGAVAPYAIMVVVVDMLTQILMRFQSYWDTLIMAHLGGQRKAQALAVTLGSMGLGMGLAGLAAFNTWWVAPAFLRWWVGEEYVWLALPLAGFALVLLGTAIQLATTPYFNGLGEQRANAGLGLGEVALKLALVVPCALVWGIPGMVAAGVGAAWLAGLWRLHLLGRLAGYGLGVVLRILWQQALPLVWPLLGMLLGVLLLQWAFPASHFALLVGLLWQVGVLIVLFKKYHKTYRHGLAATYPALGG